MKKKILILFILFSSLTFFLPKFNAYVRIDTNEGYFDPNSYDISNVNTAWTWSSGSEYNSNSPWLYSISNYIYLGQAKGSIINVNADFLFGISYNSNVVGVESGYYNGSLNTLKASNLRCGIGDYKSGYYTGSSPIISNFSVSVVDVSVSSIRSQVLYRIKFDYKQDIQSVNLSSTNFSCWFEREPSTGLFTQILNLDSSYTNFKYYYYTGGNYYFKVNITDDPNTPILNNITNQNQTIINQNEQTNETLNDINSTLNDDTEPNSDISSLGGVSGYLPEGPVDSLLNIPNYFLSTTISSLGGTCTPFTGKFVFDTDLSLPCFGDTFYQNDGTISSALMTFIDLIPSTFILIKYFKHLYKKVDRAVSMETNSDDEWGVI